MNKLVLVLLAAVACGGSDPVGVQPLPPPPPPRAGIVIGIIGGAGQTDTVARPLAQRVVAQVSDSAMKAAAPNVVVNWFRVAGADTIFFGAALTDDAGQAKLQWTLLPLAGDQSVVAWVIDTAGRRTTYADAHATALPDRAATVELLTTSVHAFVGDTIWAAPFILGATDRYGNKTAGHATLIATTPAWWRSVGDSALVSLAEGDDTLAVVVDAARAPVIANTARDLTRSTWTIAYACGTIDPTLLQPDAVDSIDFNGVVDSLVVSHPGTYQAFTMVRQIRHHVQPGTSGWVDTVATGTEWSWWMYQTTGEVHYDFFGLFDFAQRGTWNETAYVGGDLQLCGSYPPRRYSPFQLIQAQ